MGLAKIAAALVLWSASCVAAAADGSVLRVALNADIRGLEPGVGRDANSDLVIHHVVESLVALRRDMTVGPSLAESWTVSPDGRQYSFLLRKGARFHNGAQVTSAEVRWSWQRYLATDSEWGCRSWFDGTEGEGGVRVDAIETPDRRTVVFRLDRPNALFLTQLANIQCPAAILHPDSLDAAGRWRTPVATGPYRLATWRRGQFVELERFEGYVPLAEPGSGYAGARIARIDRLRFVVIPEAVAAIAALKGGSVDVVPHVSPDSIAELERLPGIRLYHQSLLGWTVLLLNTRDPVLRDLRMRRALAHVIQRDRIVQVNTGGMARVNSSVVPVDSAYHSRGHDEWYAYDLAFARRLVRESGYRGQPLRIQTNRRYKNMFDNAVVIQAMLQSAGIRAELEVMDWASQLARYQSGKFQLSAFSYSARPDPAIAYAGLIGDRDERGSVQWEDAGAAALLARLGTEFDPARRGATLLELHRRMVEQVPIIGLYNGHATAAASARLRGLETWAPGTVYFWGVVRSEDGDAG